MSVKPITSHSQFISIMMEEGKTAIVDFESERCPHCKAIAPTFDELASKFSSDKVEFYVIDAEKLDDVSFEVGGITSYPTFIAFKDGNKMEESTFGAARERLQKPIFTHHTSEICGEILFSLTPHREMTFIDRDIVVTGQAYAR
ncbi:thioredoxin-like protein [Suillus occidentalis]|nr:thioredoxin-like protein [Suillus occidentalis]